MPINFTPIKESLSYLGEYVCLEDIVIAEESNRVESLICEEYPAIVLIDPSSLTQYLTHLDLITSILIHVKTGALALCFALDPEAVDFLCQLQEERNLTLFTPFLAWKEVQDA